MPVPIAEVISIGDEITSGANLDTNSQWLSQRLGELGYRVLFHTTVGDDLAACTQAFSLAAKRAAVVVATGGLGPTADDLTREAIAAATQRPLELDPHSLQHIEAIFARRGRPMPERNRQQAMRPGGSDVIPNPQGTAPGIHLPLPELDSRIIALPGVPAEMHEMWLATVEPILSTGPSSVIRSVIRRAVVKCFGIGESDMESLLGDMIARQRSPLVGITVSKATISLRIEAIAATEAEALQQIATTRSEIYQKAAPYIFGEGDGFELEHAIVQRLQKLGRKLRLIEVGADCPLAGMLARTGANEVLESAHWFPSKNHLPASLAPDPDLWCLTVEGYPHIDSAKQQTGAVTTAADVSITISPPSHAIPQVLQDTIHGHWDILTARIAKTALFQLLQSTASLLDTANQLDTAS